MPQIDWDDSLPEEEPIRIHNPKDGKCRFILLGSYRALWLHYKKPQSEPCLGNDCPKPRHKLHTYQRAYVSAMLENGPIKDDGSKDWQRVLIGFNPSALGKLIRTHGNLRGLLVMLEVEQNGRRQSVVSAAYVRDTAKIYPDFAIEPILYRVFRMRPDVKPAKSELELPGESLPVELDAIAKPLPVENSESSSNKRNGEFLAKHRLENKNGFQKS
jgi:hypothetical protein